MEKRIWITWEKQRRNRSLSNALNAQLIVLEYQGNRWLRYIILSFKTLRLIINEKPDFIIAQNPSIVLGLLAGITGKLLRIPSVMDAHNAGLFPLEGKSKILNILARYINSLSDIVIVSNENLRIYLEQFGINAVAIPDPIPVIQTKKIYKIRDDRFSVIYICSWSKDEPYNEVIEAANLLGDSYIVYITGKVKVEMEKLAKNLPDNVELTGFLSEEEYDSLLSACDVAMTLTMREDCLVCGAYEGVATGKPLILSDKIALRNYFNSGTVFTENKSTMIANSIIKCRENYELLVHEVEDLKKNKIKHMKEIIKEFNLVLSEAANRISRNKSYHRD